MKKSEFKGDYLCDEYTDAAYSELYCASCLAMFEEECCCDELEEEDE